MLSILSKIKILRAQTRESLLDESGILVWFAGHNDA